MKPHQLFCDKTSNYNILECLEKIFFLMFKVRFLIIALFEFFGVINKIKLRYM